MITGRVWSQGLPSCRAKYSSVIRTLPGATEYLQQKLPKMVAGPRTKRKLKIKGMCGCVCPALTVIKPWLFCIDLMEISHSLNCYSPNSNVAKNTTLFFTIRLFVKLQRRLRLLLCQVQRSKHPSQPGVGEGKALTLHRVCLPSRTI